MWNWFKSSPQPQQTNSPSLEQNKSHTIELTTFHENWSINNLSEDDFHKVFGYLSQKDLMKCRLVCKTWKDYLKTLPELTVTEPNSKLSSLFREIKRLNVDPSSEMDCSALVTRLSNLTSLKCGKISQDTLNELYTLKRLECPNVIPPYGVEQIVSESIQNIRKYTSLTSLQIYNITDSDIPSIGKLTGLKKLSISSKKFVGKIEDMIDVSQLTSLEISNAPLGPEFYYNLYLFPYLVFIGFTRCHLPISGVSAQTPLSQLSPSDGFIYLAGCNSLRYLYLNESEVTNYHLDVLARMDNLLGISLKGCPTLSDYSLTPFKTGPIRKSLEELNISDTMVTHIGLQVIARLKYLRVLDISHCDGIKILSPLNSLKYLEVLRLSNVHINSDTLQDAFRIPPKYLQQLLVDARPIDDPLLTVICSKFPNLVSVNLKESQITSRGVEALQMVKYLRYVDFSKTSVDDQVFEYLSKITSLETISFEDCQNISGEGVHVLEPLRGLRVLNFNGCKNFSEYSLKEMEDLSVETLRVSGANQIGMEAWKYIAQIEQLKRLDLSFTSVEDNGIQEMLKSKWLEVIYLRHTKITDKSIETLLCCNLIRKIDARETNVKKQYNFANCIVITKDSSFKQNTFPVQQQSTSHSSHSSSSESSEDDSEIENKE
ncbi:leucine rich repeat protein [Entamoeba histolytica HM-1:IMSS-B]|uniref:Leucine rich repeat protein n=6 Tax=Entamoeba histolytica TaxID=5759 RepID=C4M657_ENTH1|nr:uncharacterized protein EHI_042890 [Entamoeba histolytica HM-1:IMSS]EMD47387.1 Fbox/leucine rich repeat-containing protein [Entamoeba histolytica KU27]EMH72544.1 leucine rich repeat protein [Entamoeba histolytica HM-1:IMSS-B]EMS16749.1 F-box/leucine rich repeat protein [Entamoeba histolytica HM-3:IMSS]ENY61050.1 F-box/leucine rich repeat protein [Entamoeba histolytica HM-1:IMSS-A]GAT96941.1 leucine rich repeat protein [Entamoeba histolytica]|eukprot:XP_652634.1 uncharacterized protein EHI_042890 [Entamoeba histolytica HM-1:IMSS]